MRRVIKIATVAIVLLFVVSFGERSTAGRRKPPMKLVDVRVVHGYADTQEAPNGFIDLTGASTRVRAKDKGLLVIRFNAETRCTGNAGTLCLVRVLVDGMDAYPINDGGTRIDNHNSGGWQSRGVERSIAVGRGGHDVVVQWSRSGPEARFQMGAWHLTVESYRKT